VIGLIVQTGLTLAIMLRDSILYREALLDDIVK